MRHLDYVDPPEWHCYPAGNKPSSGRRKGDFRCRICSLRKPGGEHYGSGNDKHYGNYPTHCPVWAKMSMAEKLEVTHKARYCIQCMRHDYVRNSEEDHQEHLDNKCGVKLRKNKFTCLHDGCLTHSWVCEPHREENKPLFATHINEMGDKASSFNFLTRSPPPYRATRLRPAIPSRQSQLDYVFADNPHQRTHQANVQEEELAPVPEGRNSSRPMNEVLVELKELTPDGDELCTKLKEPPLFMFSTTPGRDSDVTIFYDGGNSHCLFDKGTPDNLYGVKLEDGPHSLGAVGTTTVWGGDTWICQPKTTNGRREILIGVEIDDITTPFPRVDLREATAELKADDPTNAKLQALSVPESVGGVVNILLGIQYAAHFPKLVHQLESGLGIYEVKLHPGSDNYTAAIAGPHHSFDLIMGHVGDAVTMLASFKQGLEQWRTEGPPLPKSIRYTDFLSHDELQAAHAHRRAELTNLPDMLDWDDITGMEIKDETTNKKTMTALRHRIHTETRDDYLDSEEDSVFNTGFYVNDSNFSEEPSPEDRRPQDPILCSICKHDIPTTPEDVEELLNDLSIVEQKIYSGETLCREGLFYRIYSVSNTQVEEPDLATMKQYTANLEGLIKIEYRCPRCRNCQPCRDADETEKISLREEAEQAEVEASVRLDVANKKFLCKLPLRGNPEDFLSTNMQQAEKILDRQVRLYTNDEVTKPLIIKAMKKLFDNGHVDLLKNLPLKTQQRILEQPVNYFIPWRVVFKSSSLSTPARPVFDCSARTPITSEGKGGRCLNDLMCKGRNMSFNLIKMLLRFCIGSVGLSGDIKQFYNVFKLEEEFWHLQLFLWKEDLKVDTPTLIAVIKTLIYGNKSSAPLSEEGMRLLAERVRPVNPELADFIMEARFVDDLNDSFANITEADLLREAVDKAFAEFGAEAKGWAITGKPPPAEISEDGIVGVAGTAWHPESDYVELKINPLHFGKPVRGRLPPKTPIFIEGSFSMDNFVPRKLTKRMITSKFMGIFDLRGLLIPLTARFKRDLRDISNTTPDWDTAVTNEHRTTWVKNFMDLEKIRGMKFTRPRMPVDAIDCRMRLWVFVDAAKQLLVVWAGVGFRRRNGTWSIAFLVARCLLIPAGMSIPRAEMEALVAGSNLLWMVRQILSHWVESFILCGDAQIPLFWVLSERNRLSMWHRARTVQVRRGTPIENIFYVNTEDNIADIPTRPDRLTIEDLGPGSEWENGKPWMTEDLPHLIQRGVLTPVEDLTIDSRGDPDFDEGFVHERIPEVLTRGHHSMLTVESKDHLRCPRVLSRANFSEYLIFPTKYSFPKMVRILSICLKFVSAFRRKWGKKPSVQAPPPTHFNAFTTSRTGKLEFSIPANRSGDSTPVRIPLTMQFSAHASIQARSFDASICIRISNDEIQWSLHHLYYKATAEIKEFHKPDKILRTMVEKQGILYNRSRLMDGQRFAQTAGFGDISGLLATGIHVFSPVIDRWSPLAYSIANWIHTDIAKHAGFETCLRHSHNHVFILQGLSLFETIGKDCVFCQQLRARFLEVSMGPRDPASYSIAPAFLICQADLFGPITTYVPGREKNTRTSKALPAKCWGLVFICMVTRSCNIQVVEGHSAPMLAEGLTRLACEVGCPARLLIDQDSSFMQLLREGNIELVDLESQVRNRTQIAFQVCPVMGHNAHGAVERRIGIIQESLRAIKLEKQRIHATGLQTFFKIVESELNSTPFGVTMGRQADNSPLMKLLSPNQLRMGRLGTRIPVGPFALPSGPSDMINNVQKLYTAWYSVWMDTLMIKLLRESQPKWFHSDQDLKVGDFVYFRKAEASAFKGPWSLGQVAEVFVSPDLAIRHAVVRYFNAGETTAQLTDRSVRSLVRLFNVDEGGWQSDMDKIRKICEATGLDLNTQPAPPVKPQRDPSGALCRSCCCTGHESLCTHTPRPARVKIHETHTWDTVPLPEECQADEETDHFLDLAGHQSAVYDTSDAFTSAMMSMRLHFKPGK